MMRLFTRIGGRKQPVRLALVGLCGPSGYVGFCLGALIVGLGFQSALCAPKSLVVLLLVSVGFQFFAWGRLGPYLVNPEGPKA